MEQRASSSLSSQQLKQLRLAGFASRMRRAPTRWERALWNELSAGKQGVSFRRQAVVAGGLIADFVAPALKLVIEVGTSSWHVAPRDEIDERRNCLGGQQTASRQWALMINDAIARSMHAVGENQQKFEVSPFLH